MIKQRNLFDGSISILRDEKEHASEPMTCRQIVEAYEQGLKINTKKASGKPRTEAPLFGEFNATQSKLF